VANYRVQEFARLAGVTVRALHHYDRLGLLRARRTASGYRVYGDRDLERLEQIVALQFLGVLFAFGMYDSVPMPRRFPVYSDR